MRLTQFGQVVLPELNGNDDLSQSARTNIVPLKYGGIDLDASETVLNYKQVNRSAVINTDFDNTIDNLANEASKGARVLKATMRDDTERQLLAKMSLFSRSAKSDKYTCEQEFGMQWTSTYPYWLLSSHEPVYTNHGYATDDGLTSDGNYQAITLSSSSLTFSINNTSGIRIPKVRFVFTVTAASSGIGYIRNMRIVNDANGMFLQINRILAHVSANNIARIDIDCLSKNIFGSYPNVVFPETQLAEHNLYSHFDTNQQFMDWMILEPGINNFTYTDTRSGSATRTLNVHWSNHYI